MSRGNRSVALAIVKNSLWVDAEAYTTAEGTLNADARFVALVRSTWHENCVQEARTVVDGLPEEPSSSSGPITRSFQTARAPRGSSAKYLHSFSPVEDMRKRLRELRAPVLGTKTQMWRSLLEREAMERRHLDDENVAAQTTLLGERNRPSSTKDLEGTLRTDRIRAHSPRNHTSIVV